MRTRLALFALWAVALAAPACTVVEWDFYFVEPATTSTTTSSTTSTTTSTSSAALCAPGATQPCYDGPAGTEGVGLCKAGEQTCADDGASWGACEGEVLPAVEDCHSGQDQNCDGAIDACPGATLWAKRFGDANDQTGRAIATDAAGNVYVAGDFGGSIDCGNVLSSAGSGDIFVLKLDPNGSPVWARRFGDASNQYGAAVAVDGAGNVLVTGHFSGAFDVAGATLASKGGDDIFVIKLDKDGNAMWGRSFGGSGSDFGEAIAVDSAGDVLIAGSFYSTVTFGSDAHTSKGGADIFILKLDASGGYVWSKSLGSTGTDAAHAVAVDGSGNVLVTGSFFGAVDFGGGAVSSAGGADAFVLKLDASGGYVWSKGLGDAAEQQGTGIAADSSGNVLVTGYFFGAVDFGGGVVTSNGADDAFVLKLDASGGYVWSKGLGGTGTDAARAVAADGSGNVLVTGYFFGAVDFGGGTLTSGGAGDLFVLKLDASGAHQWSRGFGDDQSQAGNGVAADAHGNVLVTGGMAGSADFGGTLLLTSAGGADILVAKFSP